MNILVINAGSSSLKYQLLNPETGVPVLAMHAPFEVVSKLDCYETYKGMKAVYEAE